MSSPIEAQGARDPVSLAGERRKQQRHPAKAKVEVIRECDNRRIPLPVELIDISLTGIGLLAGASFAPSECVRIRLRNDVRRFIKEVRGVIRWAQLMENGKFRVGIELHERFSSLDMQLLKQLGVTGESGQSGPKVWV
jgi:hypothetical protein